MTRRNWIALAAAAAARAQNTGPVRYRDYPRCLPDYISALAAEARARREAALAGLTTPAAIKARQHWVRETFWQLAGGRPEPSPLKLRTLGGFERPGYRLEKLVYEGRPDVPITANLYLPTTGKPPYPGVLFQMGHSQNGKAFAMYQKCCQGLARLNYVVLAFDPMGQGERLYYPGLGASEQHFAAGRELLLHGFTATRFQVWDAVRSLDVLAAHPSVDPTRLASTGQSGGGTLTQLLACVDDRLAAAAVACGNTENFACAGFIPPGSTADPEQNLVGSGLVGFDRWDLTYPLAPKPLLVLASARDPFDTYSPVYLADGRAEFARLQAVYDELGHPDRVAWFETPLTHALSYGLRLRIYSWFERWLKMSDRAITEEPPVQPEPEEMLRCGVPMAKPAFDARGPLRMAPARKPRAAGSIGVVGRVPAEGVDIEACEVASDPGVYLPVWRYLPRRRQTGAPLVVVLDPRGRNAWAGEDGLYHRLAHSGLCVCAPDLRGSGDLKPEVSRGAVAFAEEHASEDAWAWASLILGRPLLTQRVDDVLAVVAALAGPGPLIVAASGSMTVPALFAAAADVRVSALYLAGALPSLADPAQPVANLLPGALSGPDLPDLIRSLAPRRVHVARESEWTVESLRAFAVSSTGAG